MLPLTHLVILNNKKKFIIVLWTDYVGVANDMTQSPSNGNRTFDKLLHVLFVVLP